MLFEHCIKYKYILWVLLLFTFTVRINNFDAGRRFHIFKMIAVVSFFSIHKSQCTNIQPYQKPRQTTLPIILNRHKLGFVKHRQRWNPRIPTIGSWKKPLPHHSQREHHKELEFLKKIWMKFLKNLFDNPYRTLEFQKKFTLEYSLLSWI